MDATDVLVSPSQGICTLYSETGSVVSSTSYLFPNYCYLPQSVYLPLEYFDSGANGADVNHFEEAFLDSRHLQHDIIFSVWKYVHVKINV